VIGGFLLLKPDGLGERQTEPTLEPLPKKEKKLSLVKSSEVSTSIDHNKSDSKEKGSQFTPILEFIKKKKSNQKNTGPLSKRGVGVRKYNESLNLENRMNLILNPMIINTTK
jgi:hypothetical protein